MVLAERAGTGGGQQPAQRTHQHFRQAAAKQHGKAAGPHGACYTVVQWGEGGHPLHPLKFQLGAVQVQFAIRHTAGNGVDGLHMAQVGGNRRNMPHSADRSVLGGSKNAVGQHINMEIHNAEAAGHDLHGVLRAEHLAAIGQHSLAAVHDQIERQISHECSPAQRQTPGNGHTGAGQWLPSTGSRAPSRYQ